MWNGTRVLSEKIAEGLREGAPVTTVKLVLSENLRAAGFEVVGEGFRALWNPDDRAMSEAVVYGRRLAQDLQ